jgi:hypothetical protein
MSWAFVAILVVFLIIWMSLTFTNQFCTGMVGFGLCYKSADDPACPVCPAPVAAPMAPPVTGPAAAGTSTYEMEPYSK